MEKATKSLLSTEDLNLPKAPVMHEHSPRCRTEEDGVLTIYITDMYDVLKTEDYATFKMIFQLFVKNPVDYLKGSTTLNARIQDSDSNTIRAVSNELTGLFQVIKPDIASLIDSSALVAFGKDPLNKDQQKLGVGIYSENYALKFDGTGTASDPTMSATCPASASCNCFWSSDQVCQKITNALEIKWQLPYAIPDDTTKATMSCQDSDASGNHIKMI